MSDYQKVPVPEGSIISSDAQHEALQNHIEKCGQCQNAIARSGKDISVAAKTKMCDEYLRLIRMFATMQ